MTSTKELTPQQRFERGSAFALSAALVGDRAGLLAEILKRPVRRRRIYAGGYDVDAFIIPGRVGGNATRTLLFGADRPLGDLSTEVSQETRVGARFLPLVTKDKATVYIHADVVIGNENKARESHDHKRIAELYLPTMEGLARLSGWTIALHLNTTTTQSPFLDEHTLHLLVGSTPPGQQGPQWLKAAFGGRIDKDYEWVSSRAPTRGRGVVVYDDDEQPLVQLIGRTAYILFPIIGKFHGKESLAIFAKMLRAIWNRLHREPNAWAQDHTSKEQGRKAFVTALTAQADATPRHWEQRLDKLRDEIASAEERLRLLYASFNEQASIADAARKSELFQRTVARLPEDYKRIIDHPDVASVYVRDGGIHVETKLVIARYERTSYRLGRYVIRIGEAGEVSVWGLASEHPQGIPHPHLPITGTPCFGTASSAIMRAAGELRFADCVLYVLAWLKEGYAPEGAETKIEEWPPVSTPERTL